MMDEETIKRIVGAEVKRLVSKDALDTIYTDLKSQVENAKQDIWYNVQIEPRFKSIQDRMDAFEEGLYKIDQTYFKALQGAAILRRTITNLTKDFEEMKHVKIKIGFNKEWIDEKEKG